MSLLTEEPAIVEPLEFRSVGIGDLETRLGVDGDGSFEGYACRFGIRDTYTTTFENRCWTNGGLDGELYPLLFMHDDKTPVGTFRAREDENGLYIKGQFDDTTVGRDARARAKSGSAPELSVGFTSTRDSEDQTRIVSAKLYEVSVITARMASQPGARFSMVRAAAVAVDSELATEAALETVVEPSEETQPQPEERASGMNCRSCGKGVRKFICSRCLRASIVGNLVTANQLDTAEDRTINQEGPEMRHEHRVVPNVTGSYEDILTRLQLALEAWAESHYASAPDDSSNGMGMGAPQPDAMPECDLDVDIAATFPNNVYFIVSMDDDDDEEDEGEQGYNPGEADDLVTGDVWQASYVIDGAGNVTLSEPVKATLETVVRFEGIETETRSVESEGDNESSDEEDAKSEDEDGVISQEGDGELAYDANAELDEAAADTDETGDRSAENDIKRRKGLALARLRLAMGGKVETRKAILYHKTATSDAAWDGPAAEKALTATPENCQMMYAWVDPQGNPAARSSYFGPHHEVSADGMPGAANMTACSAVIGALNGARGSNRVPTSDRQAVFNHVAHHLRDGGKDVPPLKG